VKSAGYILVRLPREVGSLLENRLEAHDRDKNRRVSQWIRQTHRGELYRSGFGERMSGTGTHARLLADRFAQTLERLGLASRPNPLALAAFRPPSPDGKRSLFAP
jgi:DNA repair photolyase